MAERQANEPTSQPNGARQAPDPIADLEAVMNASREAGRTAGAEAGATDSANQQGRIPLSGKVLVDWENGVTREVDVGELVAAARSKSEIEAQRAAIEQMMTTNTAAKAVIDRIGAMEPGQRERFLQALQNPSMLTEPNPKKKQPALADELDDFMESQQPAGANVPPEVLQRMEQLEEFARRVTPYLQSEIQERYQKTLSQQVDDAMDGFPALNQKPSQRKLAKDSIMTKLALNPQADVQRLAADAAAAWHLMNTEKPGSDQPSSFAPTRPVLPERSKTPTGADLDSGGILRELNQIFGS